MNQCTILCLDGEPIGLAARAKVLQYSGYTVFAASSAEEALQTFTNQHIDIVVSDYLLRGTTGTEVAAAMKQIRPDIPVVILSGGIDLPEGMEFADCLLSKLEPPLVLLATVAELLSERDAVMHNMRSSKDADNRMAV